MGQDTDQKENFSDLLVIGAGPMGLALAIAAAQAGFAVSLVDSRELSVEPAHDGRSFALSAASMRLFQRIGVAERLSPFLQPVSQMAIADTSTGKPANTRLRLLFDQTQTKALEEEPLAFICESNHLRSVLLQVARATPSLHLLGGSQLQSLQRKPGEIVAHLSSGLDLRAHLIAATDGRNSTVRNICAIEGVGWTYPQTAIAATIAHTLPHRAVAHDLFFPSGPLGILPLTGDRSSIVWCVKPAAAQTLTAISPDDFCAELSAHMGGMLGRLSLESPRSSFPLSSYIADTMIADRIALVGDAAHSVHPLAGQGLNIGLRDVAALIDTINDARGIGLDIGAETTLERYQRWRRFDNLSYASSCDTLNQVFTQTLPPLTALRSLGLAVVNASAPLKRLLAKEASGLSDNAPSLLQ